MRLTNGEVLWLIRRRFDETVTEMARLFGISEDRYRRWEKDRERITITRAGEAVHVEPVDMFVHLDPLTAGEACALARRRKGWTLDTLGAVIYRSRVALINAEADRVDTAYLVNCWVLLGWPKPPRSARISVPLGEWATRLLSQPH